MSANEALTNKTACYALNNESGIMRNFQACPSFNLMSRKVMTVNLSIYQNKLQQCSQNTVELLISLSMNHS